MIIGLAYLDEDKQYTIVHIDENGPIKMMQTSDTPPGGALDDKTLLVLVVRDDYSYLPVAKMLVSQLTDEKIKSLGLRRHGDTAVTDGREAPAEVTDNVDVAGVAIARMLADPTRARETYEVIVERVSALMNRRSDARPHTLH